MNTAIDTIVAQATPPGFGGIAIIRVSGPLVAKIIQTLLPTPLKPRQATLLPFLDGAGVALDEGIALYFPHPHSFTGEDVLELQGHGGPVVVDLLIKRLIQLGARLARPGEFSERAFLNDKLDLAQAEAIADLITASSHQAARSAMRSLQGVFSRAIHTLIEKVIFTRMYIEAAIDFTDEEIDFLSDATLMDELAETLHLLNDIAHEAKQGQLLREGITVVIAGAPNVGKSSLLNQLSDKEVAIVTDVPGTTRDVLRQHILLDGMPLHIIDTAGLRESDDKVEQEGIKRAYQEIAQADLILYIQTASTPLLDENQIRQQLAAGNQPMLCVRNKIDLQGELPSITKEAFTIISLSAKTGEGLALLKSAIKQAVGFEAETDGLYLARRRHLDALAKARKHIEASLHTLKTTQAGELAAEDLRLAQQALDEITGAFSADDLLGRIFGSFCIGK